MCLYVGTYYEYVWYLRHYANVWGMLAHLYPIVCSFVHSVLRCHYRSQKIQYLFCLCGVQRHSSLRRAESMHPNMKCSLSRWLFLGELSLYLTPDKRETLSHRCWWASRMCKRNLFPLHQWGGVYFNYTFEHHFVTKTRSSSYSKTFMKNFNSLLACALCGIAWKSTKNFCI